jgi:hypothetical protein
VGIFSNLTKAVVGIAIETPVSIAADIVTMGGVLTDKEKSYTGAALKKVMKNVSGSTECKCALCRLCREL